MANQEPADFGAALLGSGIVFLLGVIGMFNIDTVEFSPGVILISSCIIGCTMLNLVLPGDES